MARGSRSGAAQSSSGSASAASVAAAGGANPKSQGECSVGKVPEVGAEKAHVSESSSEPIGVGDRPLVGGHLRCVPPQLGKIGL